MGLDECVRYSIQKGFLLQMSDCLVSSVFQLTMPPTGEQELELPPELLVSIALFSSSQEEFKNMVKKEKLPKPRLEGPVAHHLLEILERRGAAYGTTAEVSFRFDCKPTLPLTHLARTMSVCCLNR
jgi:hypothetical protein